MTRRALDDYERLFKRARVLDRSDEGVASCGGDVRRTHQVYRAHASRWCKCRTLTAIGVDGVRTVERERGMVLFVLHIVEYCRPMGGWCATSPQFSWVCDLPGRLMVLTSEDKCDTV